MPVPDYQTIMLPLLKYLSDSQERRLDEAAEALADEFHLTVAEREELLPSGRGSRFRNRCGWARTYLKKSGLVEAPQRGTFRITDRGHATLAEDPARVDVKYLERFDEFVAFRNLRGTRGKADDGQSVVPEDTSDDTPEEQLEAAYQRLRDDLRGDVFKLVMDGTPAFFEQLVVDVLVKMGYGGSVQDAGQAVGRSGDGGIDGVIKEDRLGLDMIYVQAKKWEGTVGRPEIQKFAGALQGQRARKGVFITTSNYSREARDYAATIETKIVLVDGEQLTELMIDHDVGVSVMETYAVKKLDMDYFSDE